MLYDRASSLPAGDPGDRSAWIFARCATRTLLQQSRCLAKRRSSKAEVRFLSSQGLVAGTPFSGSIGALFLRMKFPEIARKPIPEDCTSLKYKGKQQPMGPPSFADSALPRDWGVILTPCGKLYF